MVEWRGDRDQRCVRGSFLCVSCVRSWNYGTQLLALGRSCHETMARGLTQLESSDTLGIERGNVWSAWKAFC